MQHVGTAAANDLFDIVGRMIANEREACAKIAESFLEIKSDYGGEVYIVGEIVSAIRTREGEGK